MSLVSSGISTENDYRQMQLLMPLDSVGKVLTLNMIIKTSAFTRFNDSGKFCYHAGIVPFSYTSDSNQYSKKTHINPINP